MEAHGNPVDLELDVVSPFLSGPGEGAQVELHPSPDHRGDLPEIFIIGELPCPDQGLAGEH